MPEIEMAEWKKHLAAGRLYSLYLVAGEEKYLVRRASEQLIKNSAGDAFPEFNRMELGNEASIDSIADAALALPLFAEHKCVAVADLNVEERDSADLQKLYELLEDLPDTTTLVLWYPTLEFDGKKSAKWRKLLKTAQERGGLLLCGRRSAQDLQKLLIREAEKAGCALSRQNAARIVEYAGQDMVRLRGEIEKLCAFSLGQAVGPQAGGPQTGGPQTGGPEITSEMIEALVPKTTETTVFLMAGALVAGNYERAYSLLDALLLQAEEPIAILGALAASYVDMFRVQTALESGRISAAAGEYGDYKGKEFRLRNGERNVRGVKPEALRASLELLLEADMALKGSRLNGRIVLEELIAKLLLAAKGEQR